MTALAELPTPKKWNPIRQLHCRFGERLGGMYRQLDPIIR
jgi:hypothetical protein